MKNEASRNTTRERILEHGLRLVSRVGLSGVTLGLLAEQSGLSKSGLFAHFKSKEQVQIDLLRYSADFFQNNVIQPALGFPEGLPRLEALVDRWLGWPKKAGILGGCPIAAAMFELDDIDGPVREEVLSLEQELRTLLIDLVKECIRCGHFRPDLDTDQFVWELQGIYLVHHTSLRFLRDPRADSFAEKALQSLLSRAKQSGKRKI